MLPANAGALASLLKRNVIANYASQIYSILIGVVVVPIYLKYMGMEAYGLIGLFATVQVCVQSLDMGITPTLSREVAITKAGAATPVNLRQLLRSFELIFLGTGLIVTLGAAVTSGYVSTEWIKVGSLDPIDVQRSLLMMAAIAWLRWFAGLYRGVIAGFQKQVWQSGMNVAIATAHSIAVIPYLVLVGSTPLHFFAYQLGVALLDFGLVHWKAYRLLPAVSGEPKLWFQFGPLRRVFHFSAIVALTGGLWTVVMQTDKILLSRILSLSEYGLYSLATVVAGGIVTLSQPLRTALLPRLADCAARDDKAQLLSLYRKATQFVAICACSAAFFVATFPRIVLWVWTGSTQIANSSALTLALYATGNCVAVLGAFPYYVQYATGKLSLHLAGSILYLAVLVPSVVLLALRYGAPGAGAAWLGTNLLYLLGWVPYVHRHFFGSFHKAWLTRDVGVIAVATACAAIAIRSVMVWPGDRITAGLVLVACGMILMTIATAASPFGRTVMVSLLIQLRAGKAAESKGL